MLVGLLDKRATIHPVTVPGVLITRNGTRSTFVSYLPPNPKPSKSVKGLYSLRHTFRLRLFSRGPPHPREGQDLGEREVSAVQEARDGVTRCGEAVRAGGMLW